MKLHFERNGIVFDYELKPMKESRFRTLCALAASGLYVGLVWAVVSLCGICGLILLAIATVVIIGIDKV